MERRLSNVIRAKDRRQRTTGAQEHGCFFAGALELELGDGSGKQATMEVEAACVKMQIQNWLCSGTYPI
jgi:hypothetical protein